MKVDHDNQLTGMIIAAAIAVHRQLGPGVDEIAYEDSLAARLDAQGILYQRQVPLPLTYKGALLDCGFRLDVLVENRLPLELKAVELLLPIHEAQLLTYMRLRDYPLGLLINFEVALLKDGVQRKAYTKAATTASSTHWTPSGFDELSHQVLGAAIEVHRHLGKGLMRSAYEECMCHELALRNIAFVRNHKMPLQCDGRLLDQFSDVSLLVGNCMPVDCLSVTRLRPLHEARLLARIRQGGWPYGFVLNFNESKLQSGIRRLTL